MTDMNLIDFWRVRRQHQGLKTIVRPCHVKKAEALTDCMLGKLPTPNLMILEPPRVGKTDLVRAFEEHSLTYFPDSEFINTSYADDLATAFTKGVRETLTAQWYKESCSSDWGATVEMRGTLASGRGDYFFTKDGGCIKGVGVGGGITGFGAGKLRRAFGGAIVIDDPMKAQDKDSPTVRKSLVSWYHGTLESRRNRKEDPMTPIILDMQRLHSQDLAGHLLSTERHRWTVVQIPAHDDNNESIWPARISMKELEHMKEYDMETYLAQYMQAPSSMAYELLKPEWFRFFTDFKEIEKRITLKFIVGDTAFKEEDSNDYSVLSCWGALGLNGLVCLDQIRGKWDFPDLVQNAADFYKKHKLPMPNITPVSEAWIEDRASGTSLVQTFRKAGLPFREWLPPNADQRIITSAQVLQGPDKVSRVKQSALAIKPGRVIYPWPGLTDCRWVEGHINECGAFSNDDSHLYDDQVDNLTMACLIWMQRGGCVGGLPSAPTMSWNDWITRSR
jgi:predicted phage terminase large subunit-like protein